MSFERAARRLHPRAATVLASVAALGLVACAEGANPADKLTSDVNLDQRRNSLTITIRDSSLVVGDTATILVNGSLVTQLNSSKATLVRLKSLDSTIVAISDAGIAVGRRLGSTTISARTASATVSLTVRVTNTAPPPTPPTPPPADSTKTAPPPPLAPGTLPGFTAPQLPLAQVSTTVPTPTRSIRVAAGNAAALQLAINAATSGDEIILPDGATFVGTFHLPNRADGGVVTIRSATVGVSPGTRVTPAIGGAFASLVATSWYPALTTDPGSHGWRIVGLRMKMADGVADNYGVVTLGSGSETSMAEFPRDIVLDRVWVSGNTTGATSRCVSLNGVSLAVVDSWLSECHAADRDAQAICGWTGVGPIRIENNHLEGSGQAIMFGGSDPRIANVIPADITIRRNHIYKPLGWSSKWLVKAAFELKNAERVLFEGNVIENHWANAQVGFAILLQSINQGGACTWCTVRDVTIRRNAIRNSRSGANILSRENGSVAPQARRILLQDNSFESVGRDPISGLPGIFLQLLSDLEDVTILQNTFYGTGANNDVMMDLTPEVRLVLANNVFADATYGVLGSGYGEGTSSLQHYAPGATFRNNVLTAKIAGIYPTGNAFPATLPLSAFTDPANGNYSLITQAGLTLLDATRTGVDGSLVQSATSGVVIR